MRRALLATAALAAAALPALAEIVDRLDETALEIECTKWFAGQPAQVAKLRGRVVVLHMSDPDKITSKAALPPLRKLVETWKAAPVTVIEVVTSPSEASGSVYAAKELPAWPVGWDQKGVTSSRYPGTSSPRTYLIGPDGRIVWHAHVQALTKDLVQAQVDRVQFFDLPAEAKRSKTVAKLAGEQKFGAALAEAAKVAALKDATDADRALADAVRRDAERTWALNKKLVDALVKETDWGLAWRRAERMKAMFAGTAQEADANALHERLRKDPVVPFVTKFQDQYDDLVREYGKVRTKKDLEEVLGKVRLLEDASENTRVQERVKPLREAMEKRLEEWGAR